MFLKILLVSLTFVFISETALIPAIPGEDAAKSGQNTMATKCTQMTVDDGVFRKVTPSSKYLMFHPTKESEVGYTWEMAHKMCGRVPELEMAEVIHLRDLKSLELNMKTDSWLGLNQKSQMGHWYHGNGGKIKFQTFIGMEPNNLGGAEQCAMLKASGGYLIMEDAGCNVATAGVLCQFKKSTACFLESVEEAGDKEEKPIELESIGSKFFLSKTQQTWENARSTCLESPLNVQLVTLDDLDHYEMMISGIKKKIAERHMHPATQFWASGKFISLGQDYKMYYHMGEEGQILIKEDDITVAHKWPKATKIEKEPFDQSHTRSPQCLDISLENIEVDNSAPSWRASNCRIPKYFICEEVDNTIPIDQLNNLTGSQEPPSEPPVTVECNETQNLITYDVNISKPFSDDDIINFIIFSLENGLAEGTVGAKVREEINWKIDVINLLVAIAQNVIDTDYVDHGMINVVKFVNSIYQNLATYDNESMNAEAWISTYIPHLTKCLYSSKKLKLFGTGFEITSVETNSGTSPIVVPAENIDIVGSLLDVNIDILWYLFSLSMAICYDQHRENRINFASDLHIYFVKDFIQPMRKRWTQNINKDSLIHGVGDGRGGGKKVNSTIAPSGPQNSTVSNKAGTIGGSGAGGPTGGGEVIKDMLMFGDVDFGINYRNLRYAVTAAYMVQGIDATIQLVRPLDMTTIFTDIPMPFENGRTGQPLY